MNNFKTWRERSKEELNSISRLIECPHHPKVIIGRGGENIKRIQNNTNTRIKISRQDNTIYIKGYSETDINQAIQEITDSDKVNRFEEPQRTYDEEINTPSFNSPSFNSLENFPSLNETEHSSPKKKMGYWAK